MKCCNTCFEIMEFKYFYKHINTFDGYYNNCKKCRYVTQREWTKKNKDKIKLHGKKYYIKNREKILAQTREWQKRNSTKANKINKSWRERFKQKNGYCYSYTNKYGKFAAVGKLVYQLQKELNNAKKNS